MPEELVEQVNIARRQHREARQWRALRAIERRRDTPDTAPAVAQLALLFFGVLAKPVGRAVTTAWTLFGARCSSQSMQSARISVLAPNSRIGAREYADGIRCAEAFTRTPTGLCSVGVYCVQPTKWGGTAPKGLARIFHEDAPGRDAAARLNSSQRESAGSRRSHCVRGCRALRSCVLWVPRSTRFSHRSPSGP